ncbi:WecB/TagA/CpsF family glycosyltransferase [Microbacterium sp. 1P10AE]|uniref:WecB/TagA/CpsF family glycosyltransferase n=1 Tax=Microbacterium sp. 1P10AE TaxID=3132286 RepID=UPI0039A30A17
MSDSLPGAWRYPAAFAARLSGREHGLSVTWLNHWSALHADWSAVARADFVGIDGTLLQLLLSWSRIRTGRSSADLTIPLYLELRPEARLALIGGAPGVADRAAEKLRGVVFTADGYSELQELRRDPNELKAASPDVIILGLGAGLQDRVGAELRAAFPDATIFTAGGWLDQLSKKAQYFPPIVHSLRLGWLWRIIHEPRRLGRRYTVDAVSAVLGRRRITDRIKENTVITSDGDLMGRQSPTRLSDVQETPRRPKVLQIVTQLEPAGAQSMARWTEEALADDFEIDTWFLYDKSGSDLFPNPRLVAASRPRSPRELLTFARSAVRLRREAPDIVLAHTHFAMAAALLLWPSRSNTALFPVHHWPLDRYPSVVRALVRWARRWDKFTDEVYVSPAIADVDGATIIPNPVPAARMSEDEETETPDILIVARHAEEKSIGTAIEAMTLLPGRRLTLVGGGPLTAELQRHAAEVGVSDRVAFAGRLPNSTVRTLMQKSSVFVLPSLWEAMPVSLLEAVAENCAIVVSDITTHRFLLDRGAAVGFPAGSAEALADAISRASRDDPSLRAGLDDVRREYGELAITSRWRDLFRDSLGVR